MEHILETETLRELDGKTRLFHAFFLEEYEEFRITVGKLLEPKEDELKLLETFSEKNLEIVRAQIHEIPPNITIIALSVYSGEDREENNSRLPDIVDALISSKVEFKRVNVYWLNRLRSPIYEQRIKYENCAALQKDEVTYEEFIESGVNTFEIEAGG